MSPETAPLLVITATLGECTWLSQTVEAVAAHAGLDHVHVLSAPAHQQARLKAAYPNCVVVEDDGKQGGLYGALNRALQAAEAWKWRWMTFIADDDYFLPGFAQLSRRADEKTAAGAAAVWYGDVVMTSENGRKLCRVPRTQRTSDIAPLVASGISPFNQQSMLHSRESMRRSGPFRTDYKICSDASHWLSALEKGATFYHVPMPAAVFRVRAGQISGNIENHRAEFAALRARGRAVSGQRRLRPAVWRFRISNIPLYAERLLRVGTVSGFGLLKKS